MLSDLFFRILGMALLGFAGWQGGLLLWGQPPASTSIWALALALVGGALGLIVMPYLALHPMRWARQLPAHTLVSSVVGLLMGLAIAALLAFPLSLLPGLWGRLLPLLTSLLLGYIGIAIMVERGRALAHVAT